MSQILYGSILINENNKFVLYPKANKIIKENFLKKVVPSLENKEYLSTINFKIEEEDIE
jgi:hypothetical protein